MQLFFIARPARFEAWYDDPTGRRYKRTRGNNQYQAAPTDTGNYNSLGQLVGTNRSISAKAWEAYTGTPPTPQVMRAITEAQARAFYKTEFWDKIQGDKILSQRVANLIADSKSSGGGIAATQRALKVTPDGTLGDGTLDALNAAIKRNEPAIYNNIRAEMIAYYTRLNNATYTERWIKSLNEDYPPARPRLKIAIIIAVFFIAYFLYKRV